jgi:hypothetical protein
LKILKFLLIFITDPVGMQGKAGRALFDADKGG